jgi:hypothetical protein
LSGDEWIGALNRIEGDIPITLQGGEPSLHRDFYLIVNGIRPSVPIDLLTNLQFDVDDFMKNVPPGRIRREAPYASIRVSYHPDTMKLGPTLAKVKKLLDHGYHVGLWTVAHPRYSAHIEYVKEQAAKLGIDFRTKEFLGVHEGQLYGTYKYEGACANAITAQCECKTTELLIAPDGMVFGCHSNLYSGIDPIGNISDPDFVIKDDFRPCGHYGRCNPCDIKVKTNRFQEYGHTSVEIRNIVRTGAAGAVHAGIDPGAAV